MKQKPRWTLEMLTASLAVLCGLLVLVLLIQRPTAWLALLALVVLWGVVVVLFRCQLRKWVARWMCGGSFEGSKLQFSLEPLSQPAALLSGETVLWYNAQFRTRLLNGQDALVNRVQKVLPARVASRRTAITAGTSHILQMRSTPSAEPMASRSLMRWPIMTT